MKQRLPALDGLRGLAILLVLFTHIPLGVWYSSVPGKFHFLLNVILGNGPIGVFVFFLLTGFLMGMLYPEKISFTVFLSRRYLRLFPPFLAMVAGFSAIAFMQKSSPFIQVCVMLISILIVRKIWIYLERNAKILKFPIIWIALGIQIVVACGYLIIMMKVPASVYLQIWHPAVRTAVAALVNATLTLPFGTYIGQIDGVYWTLITEVLFYILYPILIQPLMEHLTRKAPNILKVFSYMLLFPFFYGLNLMSRRILGMQILQIHYMIYFITGIILATHRTYFINLLMRYKSFFESRFWLILLLVISFMALGTPTIPKEFHDVYQFLWIGPLSFLIITLLIENSAAAKLFSNRLFVFFGKYSYSIYLTHSFIIGLCQNFIETKNPFDGLILAVTSIICSIIFSLILYYLLEKKYFSYRKIDKSHKDRALLQKSSAKIMNSTTIISVIFSVIMLALLYGAYKPPLSLFTSSQRVGVSSFWPKTKIQRLNDQIIEQSFTANNDNLGMIQFHIRNKLNSIEGYVDSSLLVSIFDEKHQLISNSSYELSQIIESTYHPFGFPIQQDSKNKQFFIQYRLSKYLATQTTELISSEADFIAVYFPSKKDVVRNPKIFATWVLFKISEPFSNPFFWLNLAYIGPLILVLQLFVLLRFHKGVKLPLAKM